MPRPPPPLRFSSAWLRLAAMPYARPTPATFKIRYPAFADVPDGTVQYWLTDGERVVGTPDTSDWIEIDAPIGLMLLAADALTGQGLGASASGIDVPAGVTSIRSGALSLGFSDGAAAASLSGFYGGSSYGREFLAFLKANRGGIRVTSAGTVAGRHQHPYGGIGYGY